MNLKVSKTKNPTEQEWEMINKGEMIRRMPKRDWEKHLATIKTTTRVVRRMMGIVNGKRPQQTSYDRYSGKDSPTGSILYA